MKIEIKSVRSEGSCNFCQRGKTVGHKQFFPYSYIYLISGNATSVRICEDCMMEFTEKMLALPVISEMEPGVPK